MTVRTIQDEERAIYNSVVTHPLQSFEWGEFRKKTGIKVIRRGIYDGNKLVDGFQITIHKIPHTPFTIGYVPKGTMPTPEQIEELKKIGKEEKCVFIQLEPNIIANQESGHSTLKEEPSGSDSKRIMNQEKKDYKNNSFETIIHNSKFIIHRSAHPLFTKENFVLNLSPSEEELLKKMHPKTRYNIRVAQKRGVIVEENDSETAFEQYLKLTEETTNRQGFYAHTKEYHRKMWEILKMANGKWQMEDKNKLSAHLFTAMFEKQTLVTWILFVFQDTLYYPYGASSSLNREVMASNLMMFEVIRYGKKNGMKKLDMWGALGEDPDKHDPWYGFHRFKEGYGPRHVTYIGSFDLIINPFVYQLYKIADKIRWKLLKK